MKLICLIGIDGGGKTILAHSLVKELNKQHIPAAYMYGRIVPVLSRLIMSLGRLTILRKYNPTKNYNIYNTSKKMVMKNPFVKWVYISSIIVDYYFLIWFKLFPYIFCHRLLILDRYFYDTVINEIAAQLDLTSSSTQKIIDCGFRFLPYPQRTILIDLEPDIAYSRKKDVIHIDYLKERRNRYLDLCIRREVEMVSGESSPDLVQKLVLQKISSVC